jgi:hypothetical protein
MRSVPRRLGRPVAVCRLRGVESKGGGERKGKKGGGVWT